MLEHTSFTQDLRASDAVGSLLEPCLDDHDLEDGKEDILVELAPSIRTKTTRPPLLLRTVTSRTSDGYSLRSFSETSISRPSTAEKSETTDGRRDVADGHGAPTLSSAFCPPALRQLAPFEFRERQKEHFIKLLREKWECPEVGHTICVPNENGQHAQISDVNVMAWADALCRGIASTSQPPEDIFSSVNSEANSHLPTSSMKIRAVSIAPSRQFRQKTTHPVRPFSPAVGRSSWSDSSLSLTSINANGAPGSKGKKLKWLGDKGSGPLQNAVIMRRANAHVSRLKKWGKRAQPKLGLEEREKVLEMLGDALEMSRQYYSSRINMLAYSIGREVRQWLHSYPDIPKTRENSLLIIQVQICLIPILLTRISRDDPLAGDLAWETLDALTRVPLALQGPDMTATVICLVARELAYSKCTHQHSWLGVHLLRVVEMILRMRPLTDEEQIAIWELGVRRRQQGADESRPWEVPLFALCASQNSWFKDVVLGEYGLKSLLFALDRMLSSDILAGDVNWEAVALTLRALAFLSEHEWVACAVEPAAVPSLLGVFRRSIPERWFCIRFWAMDTMYNIVSHRPSFVNTLIRENASAAFATLTAAPVLFGPKANGNPRPSPDTGRVSGSEATASRLLEEYKREASKRAGELCTYIGKWSEMEPEALPRLEPVSITGGV